MTVGTAEELLHRARGAHARQDWRTAYDAYVRLDALGSMSLADLDAYASAAWRLGHGREAVRLAEGVFGRLSRSDPAAAAMKASKPSTTTPGCTLSTAPKPRATAC